MNNQYGIPETLTEFFDRINLTNESIVKGIINEALQVYLSHRNYNSLNVCAVCDKPLNSFNRRKLMHYDFLAVCKKHNKYAGYFQIEKLRKELGIPKKEIE